MEASTEELEAEAKRLIAERRYDEAVRASRRALLVAPENVPLRVLLGEALLAQEKYDETRVEMLALTRRHPQEASAHRILGEAYLRVGHMDKARESLEQASVRGDVAAADLLREAEGEAFVESSTIERWFGGDEPKTIETGLPPIEEEATPPPRRAPTGPAEPSIQIDPAFAQEAAPFAKLDDPGGDTLPGSSDMTQPMPRMPGLVVAPPEGLKALLAKARPSEVPAGPKKAFVVPPPARVGEPPPRSGLAPKTASPTSSGESVTHVARPGVIAKPPAASWQKSAPPSAGPPSGLKRSTLQGAPSPLPKTPLAGPPPSRSSSAFATPSSVDPIKSAAAASAFGSSTRKRPTLQGAPSPLAAPPPSGKLAPGHVDDPGDRARTNELRVDLETTDRERALPKLDDDDEGMTELMGRAQRAAAIEGVAQGAPRPHAPPPHAPRPHAPPPHAPPPHAAPAHPPAPSYAAPRAKKPTLMGVPPPAIPAPAPAVARPMAPSAAPPPPRSAPATLRPAAPAVLPQTQPEISAPAASHHGHAAPPPPRPSALPRPTPPPPHPPPVPHASHAPPASAPIVRPVAPGQTGALTRRMDELPTDPRKHARSRAGETTASRRIGGGQMWAVVGAVAVLVVVLVIGGIIVVRRQNARALAEGVERASDEGRRADLADVLVRLEGEDAPDAIALRARLLATRAVELGIGDTADAEMELVALDTAGGALLDARIARALVVLARGQADQAATLLSGVEGSGVTLAEALHVQALSLEALGQLSDARTAAMQAATLRPTGGRHAALVARLDLALGDTQAAVAALAIPGADGSPLVHLVRGRIALGAGDADTAEAEAQAVLVTLLDAASPRDVAGAHVLRARAAILRGDSPAARAALDAADPLRSPTDEGAALDVAEGYLDAGAPDVAARVIATLPVQTTAPARRASVVVRAALAANDVARADAALASLGPGAATDLLRAQVRDAEGRGEEARMLYEQAAADPAHAMEARTREGELLVRMGRPADARLVLDQVLRAAPSDAHVAEIFVRIALATGDVASAESALAPALAAHPESTALRGAHARVLLRRGHAAEAMTELQAVTAAAPSDRELEETLAEAALASGNRSVAQTAYESALRIQPSASAHLGLASLLAEDARFDEALTHVASAEALGPASAPAVARIRASISVLRGLGASGLVAARAATDASSRDAVLWAYRAALECQAESFDDATDSVARALRLDPNQPEALLVRSLLAIEDGDLGGAARAVDRAERSATTRGLPPSFAARVAALRGRLRFEAGDEPGAERLATEAVRLDARSGLAHLLLADVAIANRGDPVPELRLAASGTGAPPEALGRLAMRLGTGAEACEFGRVYVERAPTGYDRDEVDDVLRHCR